MALPDDDRLGPPAEVTPLVATRSTVLLASIETMRAAGHFEKYKEGLSANARTILLEGMVPGTWVPAALVMEHYQACDGLGLPAMDQFELGRRVFDRVRGTLLGTAVKLAKEAGATPWTLAPHVPRFWARGMQGSALGLTRTGPKDAQVTLVGLPLVRIPYFRNAYRGLAAGMGELFCRRCFVQEVSVGASSTSRTFRVQWA